MGAEKGDAIIFWNGRSTSLCRARGMATAEPEIECTHCKPPRGVAIIAIIRLMGKDTNMANLVVRHLDQRIVDALKQRAAKHGRSAEAEHRVILEEVLLPTPGKKSFAEVLSAMPNVGQDADFERRQDADQEDDVFS